MQMPATATLMAAWSGNLFCFAAANTPRGRPTERAMTNAMEPRIMETPRELQMISLTS